MTFFCSFWVRSCLWPEPYWPEKLPQGLRKPELDLSPGR